MINYNIIIIIVLVVASGLIMCRPEFDSRVFVFVWLGFDKKSTLIKVRERLWVCLKFIKDTLLHYHMFPHCNYSVDNMEET